MNHKITLQRITIAVTDMSAMKIFYEKVFQVDFETQTAFGTTLYVGKMAGINLLLCPNEIAGTIAEKNRQQLEFMAKDFDAVLKAVEATEGQVMEVRASAENKRTASVVDPDGNTLVFLEG